MTSEYVRVKREKQTIFLDFVPSENVYRLKKKLEQIIGVPPENMQLLNAPGGKNMEDMKSVADCGLQNDQVVPLLLKKDDGSWEEENITPVSKPMSKDALAMKTDEDQGEVA